MKMKTKVMKICGCSKKECWEGNLALNTCIRREERSKMNNLMLLP